MRSVEKINHAFFGGDGIGVRPAGGFASCPASESTNAVSTGLRAAYEATMPELHFGTSPLPTWEEICDRVTAQHELL
jgi:hypothetical protein